MTELSLVQKVCIWALPIIFAVTFHELAHAWVAYKCGDPTAKSLGRITLNPIKHMDLMGTVVIPIGLLVLSGFVFGWAKPVPINPRHFKRFRRDTILVAIAGPAANLLMAIAWFGIMKSGIWMVSEFKYAPAVFLIYTGHAGLLINVVLMVLNLLPLPPLDGSRVVSMLLPYRAAMFYARIEPYGFIILLFLLFVGILPKIMSPLVSGVMGLFL